MKTLEEMLKTPEPQRDANWEDLFLEKLTQSDVYLITDEPQTGPDNWPYMLVSTEVMPGGQKESAQKLIAWVAERGIGLAINPQKEFPDYVLSYGMVWSFREFGRFIDRRQEIPDGFVEYSRDNIKMSGPPTFEYMPSYVRKIVNEFFRDQGVMQPRFSMLSADEEHYDFAVSLESLGNPAEEERVGIAEAISWFLPPHYSVLLISEKGLPKFAPLAMN